MHGVFRCLIVLVLAMLGFAGARVLQADMQAAVAAGPAPSSPWDPAENMESIAGSSSDLNTAAADGCPILSRKGGELYMASNRPGGLGELDIWVAEAAGHDGAFGTPTNLGSPINSAVNDFCPSPLRDGKGFMFVSNRPGGCGGSDIYAARYHPEHGWEEPVNLGPNINSDANETRPSLSWDGRLLLFGSNRTGTEGASDLFYSRRE